MMPAQVLVIDDDPDVSKVFERLLRMDGYEVRTASTGEEGIALCEGEIPALVLLDLGLPEIGGIQTLRRIKELDRSCRVVLVTAHGAAGSAVDATKLGAEDYVTKPVPLEKIQQLVATYVTQAEEEDLKARGGPDTIVGNNPVMRRVFELVRRLSRTSSTVLITGESGTGKELVARAIHLNSGRSDQPFLSVNCASIPGNLLEAELFGHEKGAFTDARSQKRGLIEVAEGGSVFLDEIGLMPLDLQAKILAVLETRRFRRVGGTVELETGVRFIAATNKDLEKAVAAREFREDLYYRLNVLPIGLPPLRDRGEDILLLAGQFVDDYVRHYGGPVRELKNVIERAVLLTDRPTIEAADLSIDRRTAAHRAADRGKPVSVSEAGMIRISFPPSGLSLDDLERHVIEEALKHTGGNISRAAKLLHVSRYALRYRMQKHGIGSPGG